MLSIKPEMGITITSMCFKVLPLSSRYFLKTSVFLMQFYDLNKCVVWEFHIHGMCRSACKTDTRFFFFFFWCLFRFENRSWVWPDWLLLVHFYFAVHFAGDCGWTSVDVWRWQCAHLGVQWTASSVPWNCGGWDGGWLCLPCGLVACCRILKMCVMCMYVCVWETERF